MDKLSLLRGNDLILNDKIHVKNFKLKDIEEIGLDKYNKYISMCILSKLDVADVLWCERKIWYEDIKSEWEFFVQRALSGGKFRNIVIEKNNRFVDIELNCIFVNDEYKNMLNFLFNWNYEYVGLNIKNEAGNQIILATINKRDNSDIYILKEDTIKITEHYYNLLTMFIKDINWISKKYLFLDGGNKKAKKYILENEYKNRKYTQKETINLYSIVSALISFGQNYKDIWDYPIYLIYDLYYRLSKVDEYKNTIQAYYNGCIDTKKNPIKWEEINWAAIINK